MCGRGRLLRGEGPRRCALLSLTAAARYNSLGHLSCTLCSVPVKSELLWQTHVLGKQHREVRGRWLPTLAGEWQCPRSDRPGCPLAWGASLSLALGGCSEITGAHVRRGKDWGGYTALTEPQGLLLFAVHGNR